MKWAIGIAILALAIWFVILPWVRNYRAKKASKEL